MVEAPDGSIVGFGRQKRFGKTPMSISANKGKSWSKCGKTGLYAPKCQKSVIAVGDTIFCSHPSGHTRENGMLSVGKLRRKKGGYTHVDWVRHVPINQGFFAYSCLAQIDAHTLGVLYEDRPSSHIQFQTFELAELMG